MSRTVKRVWCAIAIVAVLGLPASGQAQTIADSISQLSDAEIHRALNQAAPHNQKQPFGRQAGNELKGIAKGAAKGAAIGFLSGLVAGVMINRYCYNEGTSCNDVVVKLSAIGLGIGAGVGAAGAAGR